MGVSTNSMYRLKSGIEALNNQLKFIPPCVKTKLDAFEGNGNLDTKTVNNQLIVTKD